MPVAAVEELRAVLALGGALAPPRKDRKRSEPNYHIPPFRLSVPFFSVNATAPP